MKERVQNILNCTLSLALVILYVFSDPEVISALSLQLPLTYTFITKFFIPSGTSERAEDLTSVTDDSLRASTEAGVLNTIIIARINI